MTRTSLVLKYGGIWSVNHQALAGKPLRTLGYDWACCVSLHVAAWFVQPSSSDRVTRVLGDLLVFACSTPTGGEMGWNVTYIAVKYLGRTWGGIVWNLGWNRVLWRPLVGRHVYCEVPRLILSPRRGPIFTRACVYTQLHKVLV